MAGYELDSRSTSAKRSARAKSRFGVAANNTLLTLEDAPPRTGDAKTAKTLALFLWVLCVVWVAHCFTCSKVDLRFYSHNSHSQQRFAA
jgi:hypothetical protein